MRRQDFLFSCLCFLLVSSCLTTRATQRSLETTQEVNTLLEKNKKAKKINQPHHLKNALLETEDSLKEVLLSFQQSENIRAKQQEEILSLKQKLNTWQSLKIAFWSLVVGLVLFGIGKAYFSRAFV